MDYGSGTVGDLIVIVILAVSALVAFLRGFVREVLTIAVWVGSLIATLYAFPYLRPYMRDIIANPPFADAAAAIAAFVGAMVVLSLVSHYIAKLVRGSALNAVDRSLGLAFGVLRGAVFVCLGYLLIMWATGSPARATREATVGSGASATDRVPTWVRDARTRPLVAAGAAWLSDFAADVLQNRGLPIGPLEQRIGPLAPPAGLAPAPDVARPDEQPARPQGYGERERGEMKRLIETTR